MVKSTAAPLKLNVGCGRNIKEGWVNLDVMALPGVDIVADLDSCASRKLPLADDSVGEFLLSHLLEHIAQPLPLMQELWRVARPQAKMTIRIPHGASDDAWTDPTHVRPYFARSFGYFAQPFYWRADYGYRGDWQPETIGLVVSKARFGTMHPAQIVEQVDHLRNIVDEMIVEMVAVKPARLPKAELQKAADIRIRLAG